MTEILDEQFGGSSLYSPINAINNINAGVLEIFAPKLASVGFDGNVPNIRGTKNAGNLNMGDYILLQTSGNNLILGTDYSNVDSNVYLITKVFREIPSETQITIAIIYNQQERNIVLTNTDTAYYTEEDWANRALGSTNGGWMLTSAGNAIFNNVAVRGNIDATSGTIGGFTIGSSSLYGGSGSNFVGIIPASLPFFAGATSNDGTGAKFKVTNAGALTATSAIIGPTAPTPESLGTKTITDVSPNTPSTDQVRYTTSTNHGYVPNTTVSISGIYPYYYNGTYTIISTPTPTTFVVANTYDGTVLDSSGTVVLTTPTTPANIEIYSTATANEISLTQNKGIININGTKYRTVFDANDIQTFDSNDTSSPYTPAKLNIQRFGGDLQVGAIGTESNIFLYGDMYISGNGGGDITYTLEVDGTVNILNNLRISGDISTATNITATADIFATQFRATGGGGSASEVAFGFDGDSGFNSGLYLIAENSWGMSSGGIERLRFNTAGSIIMHGGTDLSDSVPSSTSSGAAILYSGQILAAVQLNNSEWEGGGVPLTLQRASDTAALRDGTLVSFYRQGTLQGTISVVSTTVDYNSFAGSHWSQFKDNEMLDIYRGTVLELIDQKCEWYDSDGNLEENEQLMKVKVSDVEASSGVYGVFHRYESEDLDNPNDMRVMSLGAYIIRVSSGETVSIGDLLESAGNGCARVQNDNLIKSSTIAKATGTTRIETYADGSYTIPCVLYCG